MNESLQLNEHEHEPEKIQLKLIYFWAYVEAGLAGLLHLLHIPITGFVAGGFSIIVNVLLAHYSKGDAKILLKALGIVLAVKFVLSPFTPVGAYVAVCFQGLLATLLFSIFKVNRWTVFIFSLLVMLESALQKPLIAFFIFGKQFLASALAMVRATLKISNVEANTTLNWLFIGYIAIYIIWAWLVSMWANYLRQRLASAILNPQQLQTVAYFSRLNVVNSTTTKTKIPVIFVLTVTFFFLIFPFVIHQLTWFYLLRLAIVLILVLYIFPYIIRKHQSFLFRKNEKTVQDIKLQLPLIKHRTALAWELAKDFSWYQRVRYFIFYAIWLNVFYNHD